MYNTGTDRKPWSALETRALITLRNDMNLKFQTMKRNRPLWEELSDKLRKHFGHERTATQCSVRWKNIIAAYKDSRECVKSSPQDARICAFFKEVEAVLGDDPLLLPTLQQPESLRMEEELRAGSVAAAAAAAHAAARAATPAGTTVPSVPSVPSLPLGSPAYRRRDRDNGPVLSLLREMRAAIKSNTIAIETHTKILQRLEKILMKSDAAVPFEREQGAIAESEGGALLNVSHASTELPVHGQPESEVHAITGAERSAQVAEVQEVAVVVKTGGGVEGQDVNMEGFQGGDAIEMEGGDGEEHLQEGAVTVEVVTEGNAGVEINTQEDNGKEREGDEEIENGVLVITESPPDVDGERGEEHVAEEVGGDAVQEAISVGHVAAGEAGEEPPYKKSRVEAGCHARYDSAT